MNWTAQQLDVIEAKNPAILVSAAAGSGKTTVMVERVMKLIAEDDIGIDKMIILTFTRSAAAHMKQKIAEALRERIARDPGDSFLRLQLMLLDRARISTIHTFCERLIRSYAERLPIDPGFRIGDDSETALIKADVIEKVIEERLSLKDGAFDELMDFVGANKGNDQALSRLILKVYNFSRTRPRSEEFLREHIGAEDGEWYNEFLEDMKKDLRAQLALIDEAIEISHAQGIPDKYTFGLRETALGILAADSYQAVKEAVESADFIDLRKGKRAGKDVDPISLNRVRGIRDGFKGFVKGTLCKYFILPPAEFSLARKGAARINDEIIESVLHFKREYEDVKRTRNILDFDDLEHFALSLLYEGDAPSALSAEIAKQYLEIMIDEYQDTSLIQEEILRALSLGRRLFMVGDLKQSIYRFRNADPTIFTAKYHAFSHSPAADQRKIELNYNFRSRREVINAVNDVFKLCMNKETCGIDYDDDAALRYGSDFKEQGENDFKTEILLYDPGDAQLDPAMDDADLEEEPLDADEAECLIIAERIRELIKEEFPVRDKDSRAARPARYSDIAVLSRTKDFAALILNTLSEIGIPARFDTDKGYFDAEEVELMLNFLAILDNPLNDIPLMALMKSPLAGLSDEEIARIVILYSETSDERRPGDLFRALRYAALTGNEPKAEALLSLIQSYRERADMVPVHMLINEIYTQTGYYAFVSSLAGGETRRKNLDMLLEKAESYASTSYGGLFDFIRYMETLRASGSDFGEAHEIRKGGDMVEIMTMHAAKGLEYPIVVIARASGKFNLTVKESFVTVSELGLALDYIDPETRIRYPDLKNAYIEDREKKASIAEEQRLLYVAMTRAMEKLIITGRVKGRRPNFLEWLLPAAEMNPDDFDLRIISSLPSGGGELAPSYSAFSDNVLAPPPDPARYPFEAETRLKPKVSVSDIKHMAIEALESGHRAEEPWDEDFGSAFSVGEGALRGTAFHRAMELISYTRDAIDEVACLMAHPNFSKAKRDLIDWDEVRDFLESSVASRMRAAAGKGLLFREQRFMAAFPARTLIESEDSDELQILQGIIDAYFEEDGEIVIVDYKTDRFVDESELRDRYETQLRLYERALSRLTGKNVKELIIYSTFLKKEIEV